MAGVNINRVVFTGNLTKDPELKSTGGGTSVCTLRLAVNSSRKDASGNWVDKPNYFDVVVFGGQADNCAEYLSKGRPVAISGRLDWREWEAKDGSGKRQAVQIIADSVQFLGSGSGSGGKSAGATGVPSGGKAMPSSGGKAMPGDTHPYFDAPDPAPVGSDDDDIPF
jgi:single-strand DNA-binding protein